MTRTIASLVLAAGAAGAVAQVLPPAVPTPVVPAGPDVRGLDYLAPGAFPSTAASARLNITTSLSGVLDGAGSEYVNGLPFSQYTGEATFGPYAFTSGWTNEGDFDLNISPNAGLLPYTVGTGDRSDFVFPTDAWDPFRRPSDNALRLTSGEPTYAWGMTSAAGVVQVTVANNGRDNNFTINGQPTGTLYGNAHATAGSFRSGRGYNMLTGEHRNGNGFIFISFNIFGLGQEFPAIDIATVWFPFSEGWVAGYVRPDGDDLVWLADTTGPDGLGGSVVYPARSPYLPELASDVVTRFAGSSAQGFISLDGLSEPYANGLSPDNAMLFMDSNFSGNDDNFINIIEASQGDSAGWQYIIRKDEDIDPQGDDSTVWAPKSQEQYSFIALPYSTPNLIGAKVNGDGSVAMGTDASGFTVTRTGTGEYALQISGVAGERGSLLLQPIEVAPNNADLPWNNFMSYEYDAANNRYVIQSRKTELVIGANPFDEEYPLVDSAFYVAYVSFDRPPVGPGFSLACNPADLAAPFGQLTFADISAFLSAFTSADPAADLAPPSGQFTFADISAFLTAFSAGCP